MANKQLKIHHRGQDVRTVLPDSVSQDNANIYITKIRIRLDVSAGRKHYTKKQHEIWMQVAACITVNWELLLLNHQIYHDYANRGTLE